MMATNLTKKGLDASRESMAGMARALLVAASLASLGGCVQVSAPERPIEILRTIHSFDPCMACGVHVLDASGDVVTTVKAQ